MKRLFLALFLALSLPVSAAEIGLIWDSNTDTITHYNIYQKVDSNFVKIGWTYEPNVILTGLKAGSFTFAVTAVNGPLESGFSNIVTHTLRNGNGKRK